MILASKEKLLLLGLLAATLALRLYSLGSGLWYDEIMTCVHFVRMPLSRIVTTYVSENQHFLFTILAHLFVEAFGEKAWALRLPAALFGTASILALYLFGKQVTCRRESFFSAALLSFSYYHIWFSQNARGYTGLLFWTLFSSYLLVRALKEGRRSLWLFYAVSVALGIYTQMTMLFIVLSQFLIFLLQKERSRTGVFYGFFVGSLFTLLLHAPVLGQILTTVGQKGTVKDWENPLWTLMQFIRGMQISFAGNLVAIAGAFVFAAGLFDYWKKNRIVVQMLLLPSIIGTTVVIAMGHPLWPRFFFFVVGFATLIAVRGVVVTSQSLASLMKAPREKISWAGSVACAVLVIVSALSIPRAYLPKQDYTGALKYIEANRLPDDVVLMAGRIAKPYHEFFRVDWESVEDAQTLSSLRQNARTIWIIYFLPADLKVVHPDLMSAIQRDFKVVKEFPGTLGDGTIYVCRSDEQSTTITKAGMNPR